MDKLFLRCEKCHAVFHYKIKRGWFIKTFLFFLPVKIFFCAKCGKPRYRVMTDANEAKYHRV